jgi:cytochrome P450
LPERWLDDAPPEFKKDSLDVLQPFHVGPRGCLGKVSGWMEGKSYCD